MNFRVLFFFVLALFFSCKNVQHKEKAAENTKGKHFEISTNEQGKLITIREPFLGGDFEETYLLYPRSKEEPKVLATHKIAYPVRRVAIHSTTHLGFLSELNQLNAVKAASNLSLYYDSTFNKRIEMDSVRSIGNQALDYEALIQSEVDVIFSVVIDAAGMKEVEKLRALGQKVILISEYIESHPLDKAEWIKVFASFFGKETEQKADSIFNRIEDKYNETKANVTSLVHRPKVMVGFPWKGTWYVSGGHSYQAQLIKDANGQYVWESIASTASVALALEKIYEDAISAEVWINPSGKQTYEEMRDENIRLGVFNAFANKRVYTNYNRTNINGANDYWESGVVHPERILNDLNLLFNSAPVNADELYYYKSLN